MDNGHALITTVCVNYSVTKKEFWSTFGDNQLLALQFLTIDQ